jgi:hypothetical protein
MVHATVGIRARPRAKAWRADSRGRREALVELMRLRMVAGPAPAQVKSGDGEGSRRVHPCARVWSTPAGLNARRPGGSLRHGPVSSVRVNARRPGGSRRHGSGQRRRRSMRGVPAEPSLRHGLVNSGGARCDASRRNHLCARVPVSSLGAQCAASQSGPWPMSTTSGTSRWAACSMTSRISPAVGSISPSGTSNSSSSWT